MMENPAELPFAEDMRTGVNKILKAFAIALVFSLASEFALGQETEWNFDNYRKSYPEQVPRVQTSQSGKTNLEPALDFRREDEKPARNNAQLRKRLRSAWRDVLGPSSRNKGPLRGRILEEESFPAYTRRKVEYEGDRGEPIRAWLFLPKNVKRKSAAVLCLHQTVRRGKDQCAGVAELKPELAFGPLLAERDYVTLCPDAICFGERYQVGGNFYCHYGDAVRIYQGNAGRSIMSKMIDDAMRAVDYLSSLPEVDPKRIGSIGHSHGGYGTLFAMAFDERIKVGLVSCGFTCFRSDPTPDRWYRRTALIPRLGVFEGKMEQTPVDFHHLFAAIAPRSLFLSVALKDAIFPGVGDVKWIERDLKRVYEREKAQGRFELYAFEGAHAFTPEARELAWAFLDQQLKNATR
jgi:dienelactone hydrolase